MKGKKRFIVTMLFFINIIMLVAAVIPHHHHPNGMICMKQDQPVEQQCPTTIITPQAIHVAAANAWPASTLPSPPYTRTADRITYSSPPCLRIWSSNIYYDRRKDESKITTSIVNPCTVRKYLVPPPFGPLPTLFLRNDVNASKLHLRYSIFVAYKNSKT